MFEFGQLEVAHEPSGRLFSGHETAGSMNAMRKRAKWRKGFDGSNNGSVRSLAEHVKAQPDDDIKKLFSHKTTDFEDALEDLLGDDPHGHLGSLTDTELAYCAGWCLLAELEHGADIAAIKDKIQEQIDNLHMLDDGVGPYSG